MRRALELGDEYKSVEAFHDQERQLVALKFRHEEPNKDRFRLSTNRPRGNQFTISSADLIRTMIEKYGYPANVPLAYEVNSDGLVVLNKDKVKGE